MAQPFDYSLNVPSPLEAGAQAFKLGAGIAATEQEALAYKQAQQQKALEQQKAMEQERAASEAINAALDPNATPQQILRAQLFTKNKEQIEALANWGKTLDVERAKPMVNRLLMVAGPLAHNNPKVAIANLKREFAANEGNPAAQAEIQSRMDEINTDPAAAASRSMAELALLPGGDQAVSNLLKLTAEQRAQLKSDYEAQEGVAKAQKAEVEAQFAKQQAQADLDQKAAQLGLTRAQSNEANARSRNLGIEGQKAVLELQAMRLGGGIPPEQAFRQEEQLRKEYQANTKVYQELDSTYANLRSSAKSGTGPGDIALITGFMKMLDPGSVVRETEFATARDTAGLYDKLVNSLQKAKDGTFLNKAQREEYIALSKQYYDAAKKKKDVTRANMAGIVKNYKLNPDNVFGTQEVTSNIEEPPKPGAVQGQPPGMPQGFRIVGKR